MTTSLAINDVTKFLKYANLQMAAEAVQLQDGMTGTVLAPKLIVGNNRTSKFPTTLANDFASKWKVVSHQENTTTGFSGTLFECTADDPALGYVKGEQTISFRSTEFIDDVVRDGQETGKLEIQEFGWAFGQIADMKTWVDGLIVGGQIKNAGTHSLDVTGYSLGGHLATAFNDLYPDSIRNTYTFNGAGVGAMQGGNDLATVIADFDRQRKNEDKNQIDFGDAESNAVYQQLRDQFEGGISPSQSWIDIAKAGIKNEHLRELLVTAMARITEIMGIIDYVIGVTNSGAPPEMISSAWIEATSLDYQMAVMLAGEKTASFKSGYWDGFWAAYKGRTVDGVYPGMYDIYGANGPSAVANSQLHHGAETPVFIEGQPMMRGSVLPFAYERKLLVSDFAHNDFGDTHSISLIIDSLSVQNALAQLDIKYRAQDVGNEIFAAASKWEEKTIPSTQGFAEGDVLENVLDALRRIINGPTVLRTPSSLDGNTWHELAYRNPFHENLADLMNSAEFKALAATGNVKVSAASDAIDLVSDARNDFLAFLTLQALSPVALHSTDSAAGAALAGKWGNVYDNWLADQDAIRQAKDPATLNFTDAYLNDRAKMLAVINDGNVANTGFGITNIGPSTKFDDKALAVKAYEFSSKKGGIIDWANSAHGKEAILEECFQQLSEVDIGRKVIFGGLGAESLVGTTIEDHIYGGGGNDTVDGGKGGDHIEGNVGNDQLTGGEGRDTILGGSGDDVIDGGKDSDQLAGNAGNDKLTGGDGKDELIGGDDNDTLIGGNSNDILDGGDGNDTYEFSAAQGSDTIIDSDGQGVIKIDGVVLTGGKKTVNDADRWYSDDKTVTYTMFRASDNTTSLSISTANNDIVVKKFVNGNLGITLLNGPDAPVPGGGESTFTQRITEFYDKEHNVGGAGGSGLTTGYASGDHCELGVNGVGYGNDSDNLLVDSGNDIGGVPANDTLYGGAGRDVLRGTYGDDQLYGEADDDALYGGENNDYLSGGGSSDVLSGATGADVLDGGDGNDYLFGGGGLFGVRSDWSVTPGTSEILFKGFRGLIDLANDGGDVINGGAGDDYAWGGGGNDVIDGGADNDNLIGSEGNDTIEGGAGADALFGDGSQGSGAMFYVFDEYHGDDYLDGGDGNDTLMGDGGADELYGGIGNDVLNGDGNGIPIQYQGADYLDGEDGDDKLYGYGKDDTLFGGIGNDTLEGDASTVEARDHGDDYLDGEDGIDVLLGDGGDDTLYGGKGNDQLFGDSDNTAVDFQGDDYLDGQQGDDYLRGYDGDDTLIGGEGKDHLLAEDGDDYLDGGAEDDGLDGGAGNDVLLGGGGNDDLRGGDGIDQLSGGAGNDLMYGGGDNDRLAGGDGNDEMYGEDGNDILSGGAGNDRLDGGGGVNVLNGGGGDDLIVGGEENDQLDGGGGGDEINGDGGNDSIDGADGDDILYGDDGDDSVQGGNGKDELHGGGGNDKVLGGAGGGGGGGGGDHLFGDGGNDILDGGGGADVLDGGEGDDTFELLDQGFAANEVFTATIIDATGNNAIHFADDVKADTIRVEAVAGSQTDFVLKYGKDGVLLKDGLLHGVATQLQFANQTVLSRQNMMALAPALAIVGADNADDILGSLQNDTISGGGNNDLIQASRGNDQLMGGSGSDTYVFDSGDGMDLIDNTASDNATAIDTLQLGSGITGADLAMTRIANDLLINIGASDSVTLQNWFATTADQKIDQIRFSDNTVWDRTRIEQAVKLPGASANADYLSGFDSNDVIRGLDGDDTLAGNNGNDQLAGDNGMDNLSGGSGNDTLDGGAGNDALYGDAGSDTYLFARGGARDTVLENVKDVGDSDTLLFASDIKPSDIVVKREYNLQGNPDDLLLYINKGNGNFDDAVTIAGYFARQDNVGKVEQIKFADGTNWSVANVRAMVDAVSANADTVLGYAWDDNLDGQGGNDRLYGLGGNDTLAGGAGDDTLDGGSGNNLLQGGSGKDQLQGGSGSDTLDGGTGKDELQGAAGNDSYLFGRDFGSESIYDANTANFSNGGSDTLQLGAGITPADLILTRQGDSLAVAIKGTQDQAWISLFFLDSVNGQSADFKLEQFRFADNSSWDLATIKANVVAAPVNALTGTAGNDNFVVDNTLDTVTEAASAGNDTVTASVSYSLPQNVEHLTLTSTLDLQGFGNSLANVINGNSGDNLLKGNGGADTLNGGGGNDTLDSGAGGSTLVGGTGDDLYIVNDVISVNAYVEAAGEGIDTIKAYGGTLPANIENLLLTGYSQNGQNRASGNGLDNLIQIVSTFSTGFVFDGGVGADTLIGAGLDDTYVVDNVGDVVIEANATSINDSVQSSINYTLGSNLEHLQLTGSALLGSGNALKNNLVGNQNNNTLSGLAGNDTLSGGGGSDTLLGGSGDDTYLFAAGEGMDVIDNTASDNASAFDTLRFGSGVASSLTFLRQIGDDLVVTTGYNDRVTLKNWYGAGDQKIDQIRFVDGAVWDPAAIEAQVQRASNAADNLRAIDGNDTLYGLGGNDTLIGGSGNDLLDGGSGADNLQGGSGDDTYVIDEAGDVIVENVSQGTDLVQSSIDLTLAANLENLSLTGSGNQNGNGNELDNVITGNDQYNGLYGAAGNDILIGNGGGDALQGAEGNDTLNGGSGDDYLYGGSGNDTYLIARGDGNDIIIDNDTTAGNSDTIRFAAGITPQEVQVSRSYGDLYLDIGTDQHITLSDWFTIPGSIIERVEFAAGTVWSTSDLQAKLPLPIGTAGPDELYGLDTADNMQGLAGDDGLYGFGGNDTLDGGSGNDYLSGDLGNDSLIGGLGSDYYEFGLGDGMDQIDNTGSDYASAIDILEFHGGIVPASLTLSQVGSDLQIDVAVGDRVTVKNHFAVGGAQAIDQILFNDGLVWNAADIAAHTGPQPTTGNDLLNGGSGNDSIHGLAGNDTINGAAGNDQLFGDAGVDTLNGQDGNDTLDGGAGNDILAGGLGDDTYIVDSSLDAITESLSQGNDNVQSGATFVLSTNVESLMLLGTANINGTGSANANLIIGNSGINTLNGMAGNDLLQAGAGADILTDTSGNNLFDGGAGNDSMTGGSGKELFIGGVGNDTIITSTGADVIAFNRGDGMDVVNASTTLDNTVSLGKGIKYADLLFKKSVNDLILVTGASEQITFKDWYASTTNHSVANLQVVIEGTTDYIVGSTNKLNNKKIEQFNFDKLVTAFDTARTANPTLSSWALSNALTTWWTAGSDTAAIGGDLAYQYAKSGNLSTISMNPAIALLTASQFGASQVLQANSALQDASLRMI